MSTVTVGVPFYGDRRLLQECVRSLLEQTHRDIRVLVIGDGQDPGDLPRDSRVESYVLPENRGPYYARAVALGATRSKWHAVVDADDWVEPDWLESLLAVGGRAVQHSVLTQEYPNGSKIHAYKRARHQLHSNLFHYAPHVGLYRTSALRQAGGYSPAFRMGYDSFMSSILRLQGPVSIVDDPTYHRRVRDSSLSYSPETGIGTPRRVEVRKVLDTAYQKAYRFRQFPRKVRQIVNDLTPRELWREVEHHARRVGR